MFGMLLVVAAGAITALGDTLFPAGSLAEGLQQDLSPTAHFLVQMRAIHPIAAIVVGIYIAGLARSVARRRGEPAAPIAMGLFGLFLIQLAVGVLNVVLITLPMSMRM